MSIDTLERSVDQLMAQEENSEAYNMIRSATIKEFEIVMEQSGKLLRKCLLPYFHSKRAVEQLSFKDIFREAGRLDILQVDEVERWVEYRDNRNTTSHDYGAEFAEETLMSLPQFIIDARALAAAMEKSNAAEG